MTTSLIVHPHWADTLMYVYETSPNEKNPKKGADMEGLSANCASSHCRDFMSHPALGRHSSSHQGPVYTEISSPEAGRQCSGTTSSSNAASLGYAYPFGSSYYGCRLSQSHQKPCSYHPSDKYPEPGNSIPSDDFSSRAKEFAFYPSFASSYQAVPGYLDMSVVPGITSHPEPRHDTLLSMEGYQHWALPNGWDGQVYCSKDQSQPSHLWKAPFPGNVTPPPPHCPICTPIPWTYSTY